MFCGTDINVSNVHFRQKCFHHVFPIERLKIRKTLLSLTAAITFTAAIVAYKTVILSGKGY